MWFINRLYKVKNGKLSIYASVLSNQMPVYIVCQRNLERSLKMLKFIYTALAFFSIFFAVANGDKELK